MARMANKEQEVVVGGLVAFFSAYGKAFADYLGYSNALRRIRAAPCVRVSGLRSLLEAEDTGEAEDAGGDSGSESEDIGGDSDSDSESEDTGGRLVVVRGQALSKPALVVESLSHTRPTGEPSVQSFALDQAEQWLHFNRGILMEKDMRVSVELVPFAIMDCDQYVYITKDKYSPLPLKVVNCHMPSMQSAWYPFISTFHGNEYPVGIWDEERTIPTGTEITAIGICRNRDGVLEIESCMDLPYFLSDMTKEEIEKDLTISANSSLWATIVFGGLTFSLVAYVFFSSLARK